MFEVLERTRKDYEAVPNLPSIADIFRSWAKNPSYPILNVNYVRGEKTVKVSQELFLPNLNETDESDFMIPFNFVGADKSDEEFWSPNETKWNCLVDKNEMSFSIPEDADWLIFNLQQTGMYSEYFSTFWGKISAMS